MNVCCMNEIRNYTLTILYQSCIVSLLFINILSDTHFRHCNLVNNPRCFLFKFFSLFISLGNKYIKNVQCILNSQHFKIC